MSLVATALNQALLTRGGCQLTLLSRQLTFQLTLPLPYPYLHPYPYPYPYPYP